MNRTRPIQPGGIRRDESLVPSRLSASTRVIELKVAAPRIYDRVRERRADKPDAALHLSRRFGASHEFRMDLQAAYNPKAVAGDSGEIFGAEVSPRAA